MYGRGAGGTTRLVRHAAAERAAFVLDGRRDSRARALGRADRAALRQADGHGVGEGRPQRRAVHRPGAARDGAGASSRAAQLKTYTLETHGQRLLSGAAVGDAVATGPSACMPSAAQIDRFVDGAHPRHRDHGPRLGADHEARRRDRHRPRRPHVPRRDREPRARRARGGRHAATRRVAARRPRCHGVVRRGRHRGRVRRHRASSASRISISSQVPATRTRVMLNVANPGCRVPLVAAAGGRRRARAHRVHREPRHQGPSAGAAAGRRRSRRGASARRSTAHARLGRARRSTSSRTLAEGIARIAAAHSPAPRDRAHERLQDQRIRAADRRRRRSSRTKRIRCSAGAVRAATTATTTATGFALECRRCARARGDGAPNVDRDDSVLPHAGGGRRVLEVMAENGLERGKNGLEVYVMCEIPSNVILADDSPRASTASRSAATT